MRFVTPDVSGTITQDLVTSHPSYGHAVIPKGVWSLEDLKAAVKKGYYPGFLLGRAHKIKFGKNRWMYSSYLQDGKIYWTHRKMLISGDEDIWTDGVHFIRARCGNYLSDVPESPALTIQPNDLDDLVPPEIHEDSSTVNSCFGDTSCGVGVEIPGEGSAPTFSPGQTAEYYQNGGFWIVGGSGGGFQKPIPTPEPSGRFLLVAGLLFLIMLAWITK